MEKHKSSSSTLFDEWSSHYEKDVKNTDKSNRYPFAGYSEIRRGIVSSIKNTKPESILEMGIGTGMISEELYNEGYKITGIDFSEEMIDIAKRKMPEATFFNSTFFDSIELIGNKSFNCIVFSYSIHHLNKNEQFSLLIALLDRLHINGKIYIGDVMSINKSKMDTLKTKYANSWDDDEYYPIYKEYMNKLEEFYSFSINIVSHCSGYMILTKL